MNRSTIFSKAHRIAKINKYKSPSSYRLRFSRALLSIYSSINFAKEREEEAALEAALEAERIKAWCAKQSEKPKVDPIQAQLEYYQKHNSSRNSSRTWGY